MPLSPRTFRISLALLISVVLMAAGYFLAPSFQASIASATGNDAMLKAYAAKDSDNDGLPDWKESLYGTDPNNAHSVDPNMTDGQAVAAGKIAPKFSSATTSPEKLTDADFSVPVPAAGSVTDEFAKSFFQTVMESSGGTSNQDAVVASLAGDLKTKVAAKLQSSYTISSVHSAPGSATAYAGALENILVTNKIVGSTYDISSLIDAYMTGGDASAGTQLAAIAASYKATATGLASLSVPPALASAHLSLMRSCDLISQATTLIVNYQSDPLAAMGALGIYATVAPDIQSALGAIATGVLSEGTPAQGMPGAIIVNSAHAPTP